MLQKLTATDGNPATTILRVVLGTVFFAHGAQKLLGWFGGYGFSGTMGYFTGAMHIPWIFALLAIAAEFFGSLGLMLGLFTRPVAFLLSGEMAIGYFRTHAPRSFWPLLNGGEITVFYCFMFLWLSSAGAGAWSLDRLLGRKH